LRSGSIVLALLGLLWLTASCGAPENAATPMPESTGTTTEEAVSGPPQEKVNAHESLYSYAQLDTLRRVNERFRIAHTLLIGHFEETFSEGAKWRTGNFDVPNNDFVLELAGRYPEEFSAIVMVNPADPGVFSKLEDYVKRGARGVQVYDFMFKGGFENPQYDPFFNYLESNRIPLSLRTGVRKVPGLRAVDTLLNKHPFLKVIIPHYMVSEDNTEHMEYLLQKHDNLYFDVSYGFKKWRTGHFQRLSEHAPEVRDILVRHQDRVLFATDVVIGKDAWKTEDYVDASYRDYVSILEQQQFTFSVTGETLNGFHLDKPVLDKIYRDNFHRFFNECSTLNPNAVTYVIRPSDAPGSQAVENGVMLLAAVANLFAPIDGLTWENDRLVLPASVSVLCGDERIKTLPLPQGNVAVEYMPKEDVFRRVAEDSGALGLIFFGDLNPRVKLLPVNGVYLLDRRLRADRDRLARYPLAVPLGPYQAMPEDRFNPYDYFSILITGSSLIGQGLKDKNEFYPPEHLAGKIRDVMRDSDITHLSLETSFVPDGLTDNKQFTFCTEQRNFALLPFLGVDIISLTGNHLTDFGRGHLASTLDLYDTHNIAYYGGGRRDDVSEYAHTMNVFGTRVAFVGYNGISGPAGLASKTAPGSAPLQLSRIEADLKQLSQNHDVVIVDFQAGYEFSPQPNYLQRRLAASCAGWGADAITFLHSHTMKAFEFFDDAVCSYGPGNFLFFHPSDKSDTTHACIIRYHFRKSHLIQFELIPITISDNDLSIGEEGPLLAKLQQLYESRNTKTPLRVIRAPQLPGAPTGRVAESFDIVPVPPNGCRIVAPEDVPGLDLASKQPVLIDCATFLLDGDLTLLKKKSVYVLFSFNNLASLETFKDVVQKDRDKIAALFRQYADRILFGGRLFEKHACKSAGCKRFSSNQLMATYRDLLERDRFDWPDWSACGREWAYDYRKETPALGLDLPEDVLDKVYAKNIEVLLQLLPNSAPTPDPELRGPKAPPAAPAP